MARCKISILSLHYLPDTTGIAPYAGALARGLNARGHSVAAYVAHPFYPAWRIRPGYGQWKSTEAIDGVTVHRLRHFVPKPPRGIRRLLSELSFGVRLLFSRFGSDSVLVTVSPALFATALVALRVRLIPKQPKLIVWLQDIYTLGLVETREGSDLAARITKMVERFVLRSADRVVAIHPKFTEYLTSELDVDPTRISVVRNWTHLEPSRLISQREARATLGWPTDIFLAVHTGNMGAKQGLENVVRAARLAEEQGAPIKFLLVGDGGERASLEESARGIACIEFIEPLSEADYRCALAAADCLLVNELPGVATMAAPSKLTSYFDASRPILAATDAKGITAAEIEQSGAGVVVSAGNPGALLGMALALCQDSEGASRYGAAGRQYRKNVLDSGAAIAAFEQVIEEVARQQRRARKY